MLRNEIRLVRPAARLIRGMPPAFCLTSKSHVAAMTRNTRAAKMSAPAPRLRSECRARRCRHRYRCFRGDIYDQQALAIATYRHRHSSAPAGQEDHQPSPRLPRPSDVTFEAAAGGESHLRRPFRDPSDRAFPQHRYDAANNHNERNGITIFTVVAIPDDIPGASSTSRYFRRLPVSRLAALAPVMLPFNINRRRAEVLMPIKISRGITTERTRHYARLLLSRLSQFPLSPQCHASAATDMLPSRQRYFSPFRFEEA